MFVEKLYRKKRTSPNIESLNSIWSRLSNHSTERCQYGVFEVDVNAECVELGTTFKVNSDLSDPTAFPFVLPLRLCQSPVVSAPESPATGKIPSRGGCKQYLSITVPKNKKAVFAAKFQLLLRFHVKPVHFYEALNGVFDTTRSLLTV